MAAARLAFYKAKYGNIIDKLIAWWTKSEYSHVELVCCGEWYSTSPRDLQVRRKLIIPTKEKWDFLDIEVDAMYVEDFYILTQGRKYDWLGIFFSQFMPLKIHDRKRYFCSEWCATALRIPNANEYSPEDLYQKVKNGY